MTRDTNSFLAHLFCHFSRDLKECGSSKRYLDREGHYSTSLFSVFLFFLSIVLSYFYERVGHMQGKCIQTQTAPLVSYFFRLVATTLFPQSHVYGEITKMTVCLCLKYIKYTGKND